MLYIMMRTQIYLSDDQARLLRRLARRRRTTMSDLIRAAIDSAYGLADPERFARILERTAGVWADRSDLAKPGVYVRRLRRGGRRLA